MLKVAIKIFIISIIITQLLSSCTSDKISAPVNADSISGLKNLTPVDSIPTERVDTSVLFIYKKRIESLPVEEAESSIKALAIAKELFLLSSTSINDSVLYVYLNFQHLNILAVNEKFFLQYNIENNIFDQDYLDSIGNEMQLKEHALLVRFAEGTPYLIPDLEYTINSFGDRISLASQEYLKQLKIEFEEPYSDDGGIIITMKELGSRTVFWDDFVTKYPTSFFSGEAKQQFNEYKLTLLKGLDNTPAFGFEDKKISKEFLDTYNFIIKNSPNTETAALLKEYLVVLAKNKYKYCSEVEEFTAP